MVIVPAIFLLHIRCIFLRERKKPWGRNTREGWFQQHWLEKQFRVGTKTKRVDFLNSGPSHHGQAASFRLRDRTCLGWAAHPSHASDPKSYPVVLNRTGERIPPTSGTQRGCGSPREQPHDRASSCITGPDGGVQDLKIPWVASPSAPGAARQGREFCWLFCGTSGPCRGAGRTWEGGLGLQSTRGLNKQTRFNKKKLIFHSHTFCTCSEPFGQTSNHVSN